MGGVIVPTDNQQHHKGAANALLRCVDLSPVCPSKQHCIGPYSNPIPILLTIDFGIISIYKVCFVGTTSTHKKLGISILFACGRHSGPGAVWCEIGVRVTSGSPHKSPRPPINARPDSLSTTPLWLLSLRDILLSIRSITPLTIYTALLLVLIGNVWDFTWCIPTFSKLFRIFFNNLYRQYQ